MKYTRSIFVMLLVCVGMIASAALLLSGSEAHVINVTAKIEPPRCDARSLGYWANNEGCGQGSGSSNWADEVHALSETYSGVFSAHSGADMCAALWMPNCSLVTHRPDARCKATAHVLAVEMNVASNRLHLSAFLAGAVDGSFAFDRLHLFESSTIHEALITLEAILTNPEASLKQLRDADFVAERIYSFYENENPFYPRCIFDPDDIPQCRPNKKGDDEVLNENTASVITSLETDSNTNDNSAVEGDEGATKEEIEEIVESSDIHVSEEQAVESDTEAAIPEAEESQESSNIEATEEPASSAEEEVNIELPEPKPEETLPPENNTGIEPLNEEQSAE
ncbi:MAG: hypothetical protein G01um101470_910 [Parcubacteria group bacterium Gr01-1014_70]|nr:MAG: hypothetical protein G01um101470_910 [Parcubacteria group bacterium Gr01-1014_70]